MNPSRTVAFTGLREHKLPFACYKGNAAYMKFKAVLYAQIVRLIEQEGIKHFINGMALGSDQVCCSIVLALKNEYDGITVEAALPCPNQDKKWSQEQQRVYRVLLSRCDIVTQVNDSYSIEAMFKRNEYMVNNASRVVAIWDERDKGGTCKTIRYAQNKGIPVVIINPESLKIVHTP